MGEQLTYIIQYKKIKHSVGLLSVTPLSINNTMVSFSSEQFMLIHVSKHLSPHLGMVGRGGVSDTERMGTGFKVYNLF